MNSKETKRQARIRRRSMGLCTACGVTLLKHHDPPKKYKTCHPCRQRNKLSRIKSQDKKAGRVYQPRVEVEHHQWSD